MFNHRTSIDEGTTLLLTPALKRLHRNLHDLILIAFERCINRPSKYPCLTRLQYVSDEKLEGKCCMHFVALVREQEAAESTTINLTITAEY